MKTRSEIFGQKSDMSDYFDWRKAEEVVFPNLKLTTNSISLRLPEWLFLRVSNKWPICATYRTSH